MESADFLGKRRVIKKSWGYTAGNMSRNYSEWGEDTKVLNCPVR